MTLGSLHLFCLLYIYLLMMSNKHLCTISTIRLPCIFASILLGEAQFSRDGCSGIDKQKDLDT